MVKTITMTNGQIPNSKKLEFGARDLVIDKGGV